MIRRHVKFLVLGAVLLALPVVASAQMSRVEGMALQGDYIKDWSGIFTYTSQVANVGNLVYGELGNVSSPPFTFDRSVGAVVGNLWEGRLGTWAIHLHEQQTNLGQGDAGPSQPAPGTFWLRSQRKHRGVVRPHVGQEVRHHELRPPPGPFQRGGRADRGRRGQQVRG